MAPPASTSSCGAACRLWLSNGLPGIRDLSAAARKFLGEQQVLDNELVACELALVEACNNAVLYSQEKGEKKPIELRLFCEPELIELHVIDHTAGFDWPDTIELPAADVEHGRGLFIIRSLMDEIEYLRGDAENRLIMKKRRPTATHLSRGSDAAHETGPLNHGKPPPSGALPVSNRPQSSPAEDCTVKNTWVETSGTRESASRSGSTSGPSPEPSKLKAVETKLAITEQALGAMTKAISVRSEELAALLRSSGELGRSTRLESFSGRLLKDLLHIIAADWFVLRLVPRNESKLVVANASRPALELPPLDLNQHDSSAECSAARRREDLFFAEDRPLPSADPLAEAAVGCVGMIRPIFLDDKLLGTLAVAQKNAAGSLSAEQIQVVSTFADFLALHVENSRLQEERLDSKLTAHELEIARNIQQSLLPVKFPRLTGFGLSGFCLSARQVGGDFYDAVPLGDGRVLLVVADVMGKGVPAALFAATLHTFVRTMTEWTHEPGELLSRMNRFMYNELSGVDMFITTQLALVDVNQDKLTLASAGHCPLLTCNQAGEIDVHCPEGMPIGIVTEALFEEITVPLSDCHCAMLYTDGLTEARNAHGEFYGQERLISWLQTHGQKGQTAVQLSYAFLRDLKAFQSQTSSPDDQTLLILAKESLEPETFQDPPTDLAVDSLCAR